VLHFLVFFLLARALPRNALETNLAVVANLCMFVAVLRPAPVKGVSQDAPHR
jgi:hypothetical protein